MTAPLGLRVIPLGQLGTPNTLGRDIFDRSQGGIYRPTVEPDLPPQTSVIDGGDAILVLPLRAARTEAQAACEATANAAHAVTQALESGQADALARAADLFRDIWSKGSLLDGAGSPQAAAIAGCYQSFATAAASTFAELKAQDAPDGARANQLAVALTWALMTPNGDQLAEVARELQASAAVVATLAPDTKADLAAALGLMQQ